MQLLIPAEAAHDTITLLGEVGLLQFKDLNADKSAFQRTYANQVRQQQPGGSFTGPLYSVLQLFWEERRAPTTATFHEKAP